jgi:hypothetical protein
MLNKYVQETSHERVMTQLNPTMCSCFRSVIDTRNTLHIYKPLSRPVLQIYIIGAEGYTGHRHLFSTL